MGALKLNNEDIEELIKRASRTHLLNYSKYMQPDMQITDFHKVYYHILDLFAQGKIKKLMVTSPPQHGKSEGSSRKLPTFMHGQDPDKRIAIASYSQPTAQDFNRDCQKIIDSPEYNELFPNTFLNRSNKTSFTNVYVRNTNLFELVGRKGSLRVVGRGKGLTGKTVDVMIIDDLYKDHEEGNSPTIREKAWKWYIDVVRSRLHNDSQELIVFTRWHEDDLIGRLEEHEEVIEVKSLVDLENIPEEAWVKINFEAIKESEKTEIDQREKNEALWPERHSFVKLNAKRKLDELEFDCLYQGNPASAKGVLYGEFKTYTSLQDWGLLIGKSNYTDIADKGTDNLCSISYDIVKSKDHTDKKKYALITDMVYTDEPVEETLEAVPMLLERTRTKQSHMESNNGGRIFAVQCKKKVKVCKIDWFHQSKNKESRILTNAGLVTEHIIMPHDWKTRWPKFYKDVRTFKRMFKANKTDDAADTLTGIIEKDIEGTGVKRGVKRKN